MTQGTSLVSYVKSEIYSKHFQKNHKHGKNSFTRERKLGFPVVFSTILKSVSKSLGIECELLEPNASVIPPSKQAFSKARYKIAHTGFKELLDSSLAIHYEDPTFGTWRGYRVIAADGSSARLPELGNIESHFPKFKCNKASKRQPIMARVSLFVDLCTSVILSARIEGWNVGEQRMAEEQLPEVVSKLSALKQEKLLFIYDRGYPSLKFIEQHNKLGANFVFRLQRGMYKHLWKRVDSGETDFDDVILNKKTQVSYKLRVIAIQLKNGETEVLITSLFDRNNFELADIGKIYFLRWHIEECYKRLKVTAGLENFSGINLEAVLQEFWAHLLMCNILAVFMCDEQGAWDPDSIPEYRLNFSVLFGSLKDHLFKAATGKISAKKFQAFFKRAALRAKVKLRPDRSYSREMVRRARRDHIYRRA